MSDKVLEVVSEETKASMDNPVFVTEKSGANPLSEKRKLEKVASHSREITECSENSSSSSYPPPYEEIAAADSKNEEEETILAVLKDIIRKTTVANPLKRPSARQVVKMLEDAMPSHVISSLDQFNVSDDEDEGTSSTEIKRR